MCPPGPTIIPCLEPRRVYDMLPVMCLRTLCTFFRLPSKGCQQDMAQSLSWLTSTSLRPWTANPLWIPVTVCSFRTNGNKWMDTLLPCHSKTKAGTDRDGWMQSSLVCVFPSLPPHWEWRRYSSVKARGCQVRNEMVCICLNLRVMMSLEGCSSGLTISFWTFESGRRWR